MLWHKTVGEGQDLVLLHGWAFNSDIFQSLVDMYSSYYRVTVIDLPGHGRSSDINGNIDSWSDEIIKLIPEQSILVGWSLGGLLSIRIANKISLKKLILIAASPCLVSKDNWNYGIKNEVFDQFVLNLKNDSTKALMRFVSLQSKKKSQVQELHKAIQRFPASRSALKYGLNIILDSDLQDEYKKITIPKTVILGSLDSLIPISIKNWYEKNGTQIYELHCGHLPFLDETFKLP
tara:strand:+ start:833 stop:1534 length:702 start_codon:yes stop_codon:yes gene_type:complete